MFVLSFLAISDTQRVCFAMANEEHAFELKGKLRDLVNAIVDGDDFTVHAADEAISALSTLRDLKCSSSFSRKLQHLPLPSRFRCPISGHIMIDPVILANGQTYDRSFIERWLNEVHKICPQTHQVLSHSIITPNYLVQDMISRWCKEHGIELPRPLGDIDNGEATEAHKYRLHSLLHQLTLSGIDQKEAARELRQLARRMPSFRTLFEDPEMIQQLLSPLSSDGVASIDPEIHEDLITAVLNLSINDDNKKVFGANENVILVLIDSLKSGTIQTRSNAAAAIFSLSALDFNKLIIGQSGAIKYLVDLLEEGHPSAMKDAASAIFNLCMAHENKAKTVREGAVQVILGKMMDRVLVDELLALLALLSSHPKAVEALGNHGAVPFLMEILRESISDRSKENCVAILYTIYFNDKTKRKQIKDDEIANGTLSKLAQCGTSRAKRKASGILDRLNIPQSSKQTT